ncbi:MAG: GGDEF domain-containing protein [Chloroflexi bacterium]|nr:GGDEF domain-containing protein [Chloroflexota bacterium]
MLDIRTIVYSIGLISLLNGIILLMLARSTGNALKGIRSWAAGNILLAVGFVIGSLRDIIPDIISIMVPYLMGILGISLYYEAVCQLLDQPARRRPLWSANLLAGFGLVFFTVLAPDFGARTLLLSGWLGILSVLTGLMLSRGGPHRHDFVRFLTGVGFFCLGALLFSRTVYYFTPAGTSQRDFFATGFYQDAALSGVLVVTTLLTFSYALMHVERLTSTLGWQARVDALTQIPNRRSILERLELEMIKCQAEGSPLCILIIDGDHFKRINDTFGHLAGDRTLFTLAACMRQYLRGSGTLGRYGGEEFLAILPGVTLAAALQVAERLRAGLPGCMQALLEPQLIVTVSIGAAQHQSGEADPQHLIGRADEQLYAAKQAGRNCVMPSTPS